MVGGEELMLGLQGLVGLHLTLFHARVDVSQGCHREEQPPSATKYRFTRWLMP